MGNGQYFTLHDYKIVLQHDSKENDKTLIPLFKCLSPEHLLKLPFSNDSNSLNKEFYNELLHIIGLTENKVGGKKLIERKPKAQRDSGSLLEKCINEIESLDKLRQLTNISQYGENTEERLFTVGLELTITWINRVLFLKLLEAQLITYHQGDNEYAFLNSQKITNFGDLNSLFFQVLACKPEDCREILKQRFHTVPYLNSSLFEPTELEQKTLSISNLNSSEKLAIFSTSVLKTVQGKKQTGELETLDYLFEFLNAYDFASEGTEDIQEENKTLINASVLGLIFEKINGYKDGSFFTPSFITMYMSRETLRRAVIQKFNECKGWQCADFTALYNKIDDRQEANEIINSLKICDPAVGSGHFLVSVLNEIIAIKSELNLLQDRHGKRLKEYQLTIVNDELIITDEDGLLFEYKPNNKESQRVQETLFHEKQTLIENCLFGVDINANSVKICRLRLWIELLKNTYYINDGSQARELETLPNIDINIQCGNSLISRFALDVDLKTALKKSKLSIDDYKKAFDRYRNAKTKEEKRDMEQLIAKVKGDFRDGIYNDSAEVKKLTGLIAQLYSLNHSSLFEETAKEKKDKAKQTEKIELAINKINDEIEDIKNNKIYENAFEWRFEFPEVLNDNGDFIGFDVIIGNPPYGSMFNAQQKILIVNNYKYTDYQLDIYMSFFELSNRLLNSFGNLCFIVPNTWIININTPNIRNLLFNKFNLLLIKSFELKVFEEAVVDTVIVLGEKRCFEAGILAIEITKSNGDIIKNSFEREDLANNFSNPVNIHLSKFATDILNKMVAYNNLGSVAKITQGTKPFQLGKGVPKQTKKILTEKPFIKDYKVDETFRPLLRGSLMNRYSIIWDDNYYISFGDWLAEPRYSANFDSKKKVIVRQTGSGIIATLDCNKFIVRDNLYTVISKNEDISEEIILGILNSKFINWYYQNIINNEVGEALAQVKKGHLSILPIPDFSEEIFINIKNKVNKILANKKAGKDTSALERKIDKLVYALYGLTEEEILIVEG